MKIRQYRERAQMTQAVLAQCLGVSQKAISLWESGEAMPSANKLPQLAKVLGCTIDDLFAAKAAGER